MTDPAPAAHSASSLETIADREFPRVRCAGVSYLNCASTGPLPESALRALAEFNDLRAEPWKISQEMQFGTVARSRALIARLVGASANEIALMTNTSYGLNLAARALPFAPGDLVLTSDREYPANIYPWMATERHRGIHFEPIPCMGQLVDEEAILAALDRPKVRALVLSWVSFATGYRVDLDRLGRACRARGIWFIVDAIQGVGTLPLNLADLQVDILACGAQKWLLSPWGTGFVYVRQELIQRLEPVDVSWMAVRDSDDFTRMLEYDFVYRDDARRFEVITLPFQEFAGLNASLDLFFEVGPEAVFQRIAALTTRIVEWAQSRHDMRHDVRHDVRLVTPACPSRRGGIVAVAPPDPVRASQRLTALGVTHSLREGAIRLSPHWFTPSAHVEVALSALEESAC